VRSRAVALAVVAAILLAYPLVSIVGGLPRFPTRDECVRAAVEGDSRPLELVYQRFDALDEAEAKVKEVVGYGFVGTEIAPDGCGRWKVRYDGVGSYVVALEVVKEAESVGLDPRIEILVP
jgi:hypothetical protein